MTKRITVTLTFDQQIALLEALETEMELEEPILGQDTAEDLDRQAFLMRLHNKLAQAKS